MTNSFFNPHEDKIWCKASLHVVHKRVQTVISLAVPLFKDTFAT